VRESGPPSIEPPADTTCSDTRNVLFVISSSTTMAIGALVVTEGLGPNPSAIDQGRNCLTCRVRTTIKTVNISLIKLYRFVYESTTEFFMRVHSNNANT
jgi:hypothetical protein